MEKGLIIVLINLVVYFRSLYFGYVGDDIEVAESTKKRKEAYKSKWRRLWGEFIGEWHRNSMIAHFITLCVHTVTCVMIYLVFGKSDIAFLTAVLFSINPVNIQGSVWISGRNYATTSILVLLMYAFPFFSIIPYYFTSIFSVAGWFAPLIFLWTPYWWLVFLIPIMLLVDKRNRATFKRKIWGPFQEKTGTKTTNSEMKAIKVDKLIVFTKTFGYYFKLCLFPFVVGIDHKFLYGFGTNRTDNLIGYKINGDFWFGLMCGMTPFVAFYLGFREVGFGLWWFSVNIAMWCNFLTIQQQVAHRFSYLATIGLMYALANLIIAYPIVITAILVFYLTRLWYLMPSYLNDYWAVEYCVQETRTFHYVWLMRGVKKFFIKDFQGAYYDFMEAYRHKPYDFKVLYNIASTSLILGNIGQSKHFLELAKQNIYDEMEIQISEPIADLEKTLGEAESQLKSGPNIRLELKKILVVK